MEINYCHFGFIKHLSLVFSLLVSNIYLDLVMDSKLRSILANMWLKLGHGWVHDTFLFQNIQPSRRQVFSIHALTSLNSSSRLLLHTPISPSIMATHNSYVAYKQDTTKLLRWIIQSSNSIIKSTVPLEGDDPKTINTTGQISISDFVSSSKLIGKHISPVPSVVYRLLQSVLEAKTTTYYLFQQLVTKKRDPEIERTNASHKVFIDSLTKAFEYLGGDEWMSNLETEPNKLDEEDDLEPGIFADRLKALNINKSKEDVEGDDNSSDNDDQPFLPQPSPQKRRQTKRSGKSKKGKRGSKAKKKQRKEAEEPVLDDVPLESYRIIQDDDGVRAEYLMAIYALLEQWSVLRSYIQSVWYDVAYEGLNSAVAGIMSNIAISMVKRMESAIFADFPDHNSYEVIMNTITRGNSEKVQGLFSMSLYKQMPDSSDFERIHDTPVDVLEQFSIHAYRDLNDFITDFRKTRSGKPTKRMLSQIRNWDPNFDIHNASKEERINRRRSYTINWLYDLVNVFSSAVVQHNNIHDEKCAYEEADWSINGPWNKYRRLYGLNEFAGAITSHAMQKHSTDIRHKILPHLVFQLQCIVDSMTVSRGWSLDGIRGHVLNQAAHEFCPARDVNIFLDRRCERVGSGFIQAVNILKAVFERDSALYADPRRHKAHREFLEGVTEALCNSLGESKCMQESTIMPSSRFSNTCSNGLWEYSPFLCGVGLMEALEIAYSVSMTMWEGLPEP